MIIGKRTTAKHCSVAVANVNRFRRRSIQLLKSYNRPIWYIILEGVVHSNEPHMYVQSVRN